MNTYGLSLEEDKQGIDKINELLIEEADVDYDDTIKEKLVHMAAYYTKILLLQYNAELLMDKDICVIRLRKWKLESSCFPLYEINNAWNVRK